MTLTKFNRIILKLSNGCWVRYWVHWNYPNNPCQMAFSAKEYDGANSALYEEDFIKEGFKKKYIDNQLYWIINRTNEDGSNFTSNL